MADRRHISLTLVFLLLGFLLATAFSTQQEWGERSGPRKQNLIEFIKKQRRERDKLGGQLSDVRRELDRINSKLAGRQGVLAAHSQRLNGLKALAGLTTTGGPGLEVLVADAQRVPQGARPDSYLVHDYDLQILVNALWRGGAKAMAINGERFVVTTGIRSAGTTILINSKPQGGPYRIKALGDFEKLAGWLNKDPDASLLVSDAQRYGLSFKAYKRQHLRLPAYTGSLGLVK